MVGICIFDSQWLAADGRSTTGATCFTFRHQLCLSIIFMKTLIVTIISLLIANYVSAQDDNEFNSSRKYFEQKGLALNVIDPPEGFKLFYNCDSMLFVRGDFSDTIKIWTSVMEWAHTIEQFEDVIKEPGYGKTDFAKSIMADGRILVVSLMETVFVFRNDSLYQIEDTVTKPELYYTAMVDKMLGKIDEATCQHIRDSIDFAYKDRHGYVRKLIFSKSMFQNGQKKVKLSQNVNFEEDEIELEQQWEEAGRKCYLIRINNSFEGNKTSYAYAFNEDLKFVWWEGCESRN